MSNDFLAALGELLSAAPQAKAAAPQQMPFPMVDARKGGRVLDPPMVLPPNGPMPTPRPQQGLSPSRMPASPPVPTPRPAAPPAPMPVQTAPVQPMPQQRSANPLASLLSGGSHGGSLQQILRAVGSGLATVDPRNDDPFSTLGRAMSGASGYYLDQDQQQYNRGQDAADRSLQERKFGADQSQRAFSNNIASADADLRQAAAQRQARMDDLTMEKSAKELERMSKQNGISIDQMLEIERVAQAAGEGLYGSTRTKVIEDKRRELLTMISGQGGPQGLSGQSAVSGGDMTATNPETGERVRFDPSSQQWVPIQ